jgi:hypothetical protein
MKALPNRILTWLERPRRRLRNDYGRYTPGTIFYTRCSAEDRVFRDRAGAVVDVEHKSVEHEPSDVL